MKLFSLEEGLYGVPVKACAKIDYKGYTISLTSAGAGIRVYDEDDELLFEDARSEDIEDAISFINNTIIFKKCLLAD
jgi:hypothetical protein